ncbi:MAG: helix-turn-helix transcriptional regulator [Halarchaeum sp.]
MFDLTGFQRDLLFVTAGLDAPNGLDVKDELEEYYGTPINHGRLYPNLDTLVDKGLVDKRKRDQRTNAYSLTARGRREILDRESWEHQYVEELVEEEAESVR